MLGSEARKEEWIVADGGLDKIGTFALTEPEHGSDSVAWSPAATRTDGASCSTGEALDRQRLDRRCDRRLGALGRGRTGATATSFPTDSPGFSATTMEGKGVARAHLAGEIRFENVFVPAGNDFPGRTSFKDASRVLLTTRVACAWSAVGHAIAGYETARTVCKAQRRQFGKPLCRSRSCRTGSVKMLARRRHDAALVRAARAAGRRAAPLRHVAGVWPSSTHAHARA